MATVQPASELFDESRYQEVFNSLKKDAKNKTRFFHAIYTLQAMIHNELDISRPIVKEGYQKILKIYLNFETK